MSPDLRVRRARPQDAAAISRLNNTFADAGRMLRRSPEMVAATIEDYVVVHNVAGEIVACGARKEYSPSVAEVAAIASPARGDLPAMKPALLATCARRSWRLRHESGAIRASTPAETTSRRSARTTANHAAHA